MVSILHDNYLIIILSWLSGLIGIFGNIYVLSFTLAEMKVVDTIRSRFHFPPSTPTNSMRKQTFNILITNLAISDLLGSCYLIILAGSDIHYRYINVTLADLQVYNSSHNVTPAMNTKIFVYSLWLSDPVCYILRFIHVIAITQSVNLAVLIAIDRYLRIIYPYSTTLRMTSKHALLNTLISWVASFILAIIDNNYAKLNRNFDISKKGLYLYNNLCTITVSNPYAKKYLPVMIIVGLVLYIAVIYMYTRIAFKVRKVNSINSVKSNAADHKMERSVLLIACLITVTNFLLWFPAFISGLITSFANESIFKNETFMTAIAVFAIIFQSNSGINPIIIIMSIRKKKKIQTRCFMFHYKRNCHSLNSST